MNKRTCFLFALSLLCSTKLIGQLAVANLAVHDELKDSIISQFNRNEFNSIYQLADTIFFSASEQNLTKFFTNHKRDFGKILSSTFLADSVCEDCDSKRGKYYLLEFQFQSFIMVLEVTPSKKISSFILLNYTYPERTETSMIKTNNPLRSSFDLSVDSAARYYFRNPNAVGLSIGIIKNGKRLTYNYGETAKGNNQVPTKNTIYELGSIGKTFTATILAHAVLENRMSLNDDIRKYLPQPFPNLQYNGQGITLQDLANHTSRIPSIPDNYYTNPDYDQLKPWNNYTTAMFWESLHRVVIDTLPGCKERYSNTGVALLGHILENVYQLPFEDLIKKYITRPFKMDHTGIELSKKGRNDLALKYSSNGNPVQYWKSPPYFAAGVGMLTTLNDMFKYADNQISEINEAIKLTHQLTVNNIGLGWGIGNIGTKYLKYEHSGGTKGFSTHVRVFPEVKAGLVILANNDINLANLIRRLSPIVVQ